MSCRQMPRSPSSDSDRSRLPFYPLSFSMPRTPLRWLAATGALLLLAPTAPAQQAPMAKAMPAASMPDLGFDPETPGLDPYEVAMIQTVSSPVVSPDGRYVAYRLAIPADPLKENAPARAELRILDRETDSVEMPLPSRSVSGLHFLPDGRLAFRAKLDGDEATAVYTMTPGASRYPDRLLTFDTSIQSFAVTPDGEQVVFVASEPIGEDDSGVPDVVEIYEEEFGTSRVYVAAVEGDMAPVPLRLPGHVHSMALSPQGDRIAVATAPTASVDDSYVRQGVMIVDLTGAVLAKVDREGKQGSFAWSPDGTMLAMIAAEDINDPSAGRLMVVPATGGQPKDLLPGVKGEVATVDFAANGEIRYIIHYGAETALEMIRPDGTGKRTLVEPGPYDLAEVAHGGDLTAFVIDTPMHPPELYLMPDGGELMRETDSNPWLADVQMGKQEVITYTARDGTEIESILVYPVGYQEGTRVPMIVNVHGGPESHYTDGWNNYYSQLGQMAAARGYAMLYPNYRGSTGYGVAFSKVSQGDPAGAEFDDLADGIDAMVQRGLADADRIGVTGGSYGGYATGWMSTRYTDKVAAGVMFVGISNKISKVGTTDIPDEEFYVHARKRPWDDWQFMLERSPIYYAGQAKTPLLIMHGKDDPRVDAGQSYELYRHYKLRSEAPVRLVLFPGEGHGNARATARFDYSLRALQWFDRFLMDGAEEAPDAKLDYNAAVPAGAMDRMGTN